MTRIEKKLSKMEKVKVSEMNIGESYYSVGLNMNCKEVLTKCTLLEKNEKHLLIRSDGFLIKVELDEIGYIKK